MTISSEDSPDARLKRLLNQLTARERDALIRFYSRGETPEQIHLATGIGKPELRDLRSRIRAEFRRLNDS